jgi:hypothetical protein
VTRIGEEQDPIVVPAPAPKKPVRRELPVPDEVPVQEPAKAPVKTGRYADLDPLQQVAIDAELRSWGAPEDAVEYFREFGYVL